jgi:hypothetical protein
MTRANMNFPEHQRALLMNFRLLFSFLEQHEMVEASALDRYHKSPDEFELWRNDLTLHGLKFYYESEDVLFKLGPYNDPEGALKKARDPTRIEKAYKKFLKDEAAREAVAKLVASAPASKTAAPVPASTEGKSGKSPPVPQLPEPSDDDDSAKYDDASWHTEGDWPDGMPAEAAATHIGMFLAWAINSGLGGEEMLEDFADDVEALGMLSITPGAFARMLDGRITAEELSEDGNAFARAYYGSGKQQYLADYAKTLAKGLSSLYAVPDSWENFAALKPVLDRRFEKFAG